MRMAITILVVLMISKDALPIGDVYIMRGLSQVLALAMGLLLIIQNPRTGVFTKPALVYLYLAYCFATSLLSNYPTYSSLQVLSLVGPVMLFIGMNQQSAKALGQNLGVFLTAVVIIYFCVCAASLVLYKTAPEMVMQKVWDREVRFTGLFNEPAMMGVAAGLLLGTSCFALKRKWIVCLCVLTAATCMYLTLSRTFIIAAVAALLATLWIYYPRYRIKLFAGLASIGISIATIWFSTSLAPVDNKTLETTVRSDSIKNLSGRTELWNAVLSARQEAPLSAEGFSLGGQIVLTEAHDRNALADDIDPRLIGRTTLHSGYIQALADLGYPGFTLYILLILYSIICLLRKDKARKYPALMFTLIYMAIANFAESVIYTASNFPGLFFWFAAIMAMTLNAKNEAGMIQQYRLNEADTCHQTGHGKTRFNMV